MSDGDRLGYELVEHTLDNGLRVIVQPDPAAPAVAVNLWYDVGSYDEVPGRTGFAHLFEHLMFQGSASVASGEHMALVETSGGSVNATTSTDRTNYFETVPEGALDLALWLEADRMASLDISEANFDAQRDVVKEEKRQRYDNQPYGDVLELLVAQHFDADHPYGHLPIGSMADLDSATLTDVRDFFDRWYMPSNASLVVCGRVDPGAAIELAERHFGSLTRRDAPAHAAVSTGPRSPVVTTVRRPVPHALVYASWPVPPSHHPDHLALDVALAILTDGNASRMHRSLVKSARVAQEVHSAVLQHRRAESVATVLARPGDGVGTAEAAQAIGDQVDRFAAEGPTELELARATAQYERDWLLQLATVEDRADTINDALLTHGDAGRINTRLEELAALDPDRVRQVVADHLSRPASELHYLGEGDAR